jgi:ATP-dependent Clp protease ATP-binding subunit ClpB
VKAKFMESLKDYFRPEFLNRLDSIILFDVLSPESIKNIVGIQVEQVVKRLAEKEIRLDIAPAVLEYLSKEGYNPQYGARPLKRLIQEKILTPVAGFMISQAVGKGGSIAVGVKPGVTGPAVEFTFDVKKGRKAVPLKELLETVDAEKGKVV